MHQLRKTVTAKTRYPRLNQCRTARLSGFPWGAS